MTTIVLLPGMDGTGSLFEPLLRQLSCNRPVKTVSYPPDKQLGYEELTRFVLSQLPSNQPFAVLGESFSGPVAISVATEAKPVALILVCSFAVNPWPVLACLRWLLKRSPPLSLFLPLLNFALMGTYATSDMRRRLAHALRVVNPAVFLHRAVAVLGSDVRHRLAAVQCPLLYLQATEDSVIPPECAREVSLIQPTTVVAAIKGPHFLLQTQPAASAQVIENFLCRVELD
uniref:alpha/beta fold hydrolase n=1 Tax=Candidatus Electronema sp. TaxID=2698783 RepID=UPI004056EDDA